MRVRLAHALIAFSVAAVGGLSAFSSSSPPTASEAQFDSVGTLNFPTSGSPEAQAHFLRGVAILHSFGWKQAIAEFKKAQAAQPDFAMAYWGETLCYNHPLQSEQDAKNPRDVLARLGPTPAARLAKAPTAREKGFLQAIEALWGEGDWRARRIAYMDAMAQLHREFPTDDEVTTFYVVALLSGARALDDNSFRYEVRAGALALDVFKRNPTHPGAPHYAIHAFDDPIHAPLALDSARAYASIAPAVAHAVHMPTHIFIQHGMWHEVASQNMRGYQVLSAVRTKDLATAEQMAAKLAARAGAGPAPGAGGGAHADHGGAPPPAATGGSEEAKSPRVMHKELVALIALHKGQNEQAITLLQEAVGIEESMRPPNGAADPVKPSHELLGEVLLANGKAAEAAKAFDTCLLRMPNRARSLIGAARAHAAAGNKEKAAERFEALKAMWKGAPFTNPTTEAQ
ncbi:MAG: hypothetical protein LC791_14260 [Acidobacteria bacterium]|nr:hypothetical protein [Acidobacteriota bacterium]